MKEELLKIAKNIMQEVDNYPESDLTEWIAEEIQKYADSEVKKISSNLPVMQNGCDHDFHYSEIEGYEYCFKCGQPR